MPVVQKMAYYITLARVRSKFKLFQGETALSQRVLLSEQRGRILLQVISP